mmetsp:Transcript_25458/g.59270  ORF Transcript_25458/g.59270 Transcript_25458/m.59270 type:complete len:267 (+) Transcript_25458:49-849(+)
MVATKTADWASNASRRPKRSSSGDGWYLRALRPPLAFELQKRSVATSGVNYMVNSPNDSCFSEDAEHDEYSIILGGSLGLRPALRQLACSKEVEPAPVPLEANSAKSVKQVLPSFVSNVLPEFDSLSSLIMTEVCIPCDTGSWTFCTDFPVRLEKHLDRADFERVVDECNRVLPRRRWPGVKACIRRLCVCHTLCDRTVYKAMAAARRVQLILDVENETCWRDGIRWMCTVCTVGRAVTLALRVQVCEGLPRPKSIPHKAATAAWD